MFSWSCPIIEIIAVSPEIGKEKLNFFPPKNEILPAMRENFPPISYMLYKIIFNP